jgi:hypothetical protein
MLGGLGATGQRQSRQSRYCQIAHDPLPLPRCIQAQPLVDIKRPTRRGSPKGDRFLSKSALLGCFQQPPRVAALIGPLDALTGVIPQPKKRPQLSGAGAEV